MGKVPCGTFAAGTAGMPYGGALDAGRARGDHRDLGGLETVAIGLRRQTHAGRTDGDMAQAAAHAGEGLGLEVADARSLGLGESAHTVVRQPEVVDHPGGERPHAALDVSGAQPKRDARKRVIAAPQEALIPPAPNRVEDGSDALGQLAKLVVVKVGGRCTTHDYVVKPNHNWCASLRQAPQDRSWRLD